LISQSPPAHALEEGATPPEVTPKMLA